MFPDLSIRRVTFVRAPNLYGKDPYHLLTVLNLELLKFKCKSGGVTERPKTMCPSTNFLGPLVRQMKRPGNTMSLHWCPCHFASAYMYWIMHNYRDVSMQGHCVYRSINLEAMGPRIFVQGHIVFRDVPSPFTVALDLCNSLVSIDFVSCSEVLYISWL